MKRLSLALSTLALLMGVTPAQAQVTPPTTGGITNPPIGKLGDSPALAQSGSIFMIYFIYLWRALITVGALMVIIFFLWGATEWIYAGGDSGKLQKARNRITQAVIGMIVLAGSFVIIGYISKVFFGDNFDLLRLTIPTPNP